MGKGKGTPAANKKYSLTDIVARDNIISIVVHVWFFLHLETLTG
jgi:hypothetical protein